MRIKLTAGSINITEEGLKKATRKALPFLSDEDYQLVINAKNERFPPVKPKAAKPEPDTDP